MIVEKLSIKIDKTAKSKISVLKDAPLVFGKTFSDHMFIADYENGSWKNLRILPYGKLEFEPSCLVFHYGQAIFEGMKAYKTKDGEPVLFRPADNAARFNKSAERMCMPTIPQEIFIEGLKQLVSLEKDWIPSELGSSMYIRPFMIATDEYLGVKPSEKYKFIIICCPVGAYYSEPVRVRIETKYTRAFEGGTGFAKAAGNYAAALLPAKKATADGYHQMVWTDGTEHKYIEEAGTMNMIFVIDNVLVTPPLSTTILAGITRDSVLTLAKDMGIKVEERKISVDEIIASASSGKLQEAFGVGTAATVAQIALINCNGVDYNLPKMDSNSVSTRIAKRLDEIKTGRSEDKFGWVVPANE